MTGTASNTFATLAVDAGERLRWVADQLGHKDITMVVKHYYGRSGAPGGSALDKAVAAAGL